MGTAAYMSPEQASGTAVDKRADIWSFGVVLFEMLTGERMFTGETVPHVLASVLRADPDWTTLPTETPAAIRTLLQRCLAKDRRRRVPDIGMARIEIDDAITAPVTEVTNRVAVPQLQVWQRPMPLAAGIVALLVATGFTLWGVPRPAAPLASRFTVSSPSFSDIYPDVLAPNGRTIVFASNHAGSQDPVYVRRLDELEAVPLPGAEGTTPFGFSPDGEWVLVSDGSVLKKVPLAGGPAITIGAAENAGADWGPGDVIVSGSNSSGLWIGSASGGDFQQLLVPDEGERGRYREPSPPEWPSGPLLYLQRGGVGGRASGRV